jgi:FkbM family methyltransferase
MDHLLPAFNRLYYSHPTLYKHLYFNYKRIAEADKIIFLKTTVKPGDVVVDVGSNIGFYTKLLSHLVGKTGEVHSFEPDPTNFRMQKEVIKNLSNVYLHNVAISNKSGHIFLYSSPNRNTDHQTFDIGQNRQRIKIPSISLDKYFPTPKKVKLIKLDIQGFDHYALQGMTNLLSRSAKVVLLGEFWPYALTRAGTDPLKYLQDLRKAKFKFIHPAIKKNSEAVENKDNPYFFSDFIATKP